MAKYDSMKNLDKIAKAGEDSSNQFKVDIRNIDSLASEMVAFSNSEGGRIFIGIDDGGGIRGLTSEDVRRINALISNASSQHIRSPISVKTENITIDEGKSVIILTIPEGIDKPYFDKDGVIWFKNGSDKRRINSKEELRRLFQNVDSIHADEIPTNAYLDKLDRKYFAGFLRDKFKIEQPDNEQELKKLLSNMNLADDKGFLNLAGLLLFAENPEFTKPAFILKAVCFPGNTVAVNSYIDSEDFSGRVPDIFKGAIAFILRNLKKIQAAQSVNSIGIPEIPLIVFEELIVNALIHRDYFINSPIKVLIFDDRIEIISPGVLPNHLTIEKIIAGNSVIRNPVLMSYAAKGLLPFRGLGSGIRRALDEWNNIRFVNDSDANLFKSIIYRFKINEPINGLEKYDISSHELLNEPINEPIKFLLKELRENPKTSYSELEKRLNISRSTVMRNIKLLKDLGRIRYRGSKKIGYWEVTDKE